MILLIPHKTFVKDGGTVIYNAILYTITKVNSLSSIEEMKNGKNYYEGTIISILGIEVYNDVK